MALKPITLRLDEEEYEKLKDYLNKFGDPDINVAYVVRAYIRDLNRAFPMIMNSGLDLKNYFGFFGIWLKQFVSMGDAEMFFKGVFNMWPFKFPTVTPPGGEAESASEEKRKGTGRSPGEKGGEGEGQ